MSGDNFFQMVLLITRGNCTTWVTGPTRYLVTSYHFWLCPASVCGGSKSQP
jgi:hypothetical protein